MEITKFNATSSTPVAWHPPGCLNMPDTLVHLAKRSPSDFEGAKRRLEPGPVRMTRVGIARGGGAGGYVGVPRHLPGRRAETEGDVAAEEGSV